MVSNLGREFTSKRNLLPLLAFYFSAFFSINIECIIVHVVNAEFPHIAETAFLKVLTSIDVEPIKNWINDMLTHYSKRKRCDMHDGWGSCHQPRTTRAMLWRSSLVELDAWRGWILGCV